MHATLEAIIAKNNKLKTQEAIKKDQLLQGKRKRLNIAEYIEKLKWTALSSVINFFNY
jgi:hypothetical protein